MFLLNEEFTKAVEDYCEENGHNEYVHSGRLTKFLKLKLIDKVKDIPHSWWVEND